MSLYREHVLPRIIDSACGTGKLPRWRKQVTAGLSGTVVEIGSGLNTPAYPPEVHLAYAVETALTARRLTEERIAASHVHVDNIAPHGESIHATTAVTVPCRPSRCAPSPR